MIAPDSARGAVGAAVVVRAAEHEDRHVILAVLLEVLSHVCRPRGPSSAPRKSSKSSSSKRRSESAAVRISSKRCARGRSPSARAERRVELVEQEARVGGRCGRHADRGSHGAWWASRRRRRPRPPRRSPSPCPARRAPVTRSTGLSGGDPGLPRRDEGREVVDPVAELAEGARPGAGLQHLDQQARLVEEGLSLSYLEAVTDDEDVRCAAGREEAGARERDDRERGAPRRRPDRLPGRHAAGKRGGRLDLGARPRRSGR